MTRQDNLPDDSSPLLPSNHSNQQSQQLSRRTQTSLLFLVSVITIGSHYGKHSLSSLGPQIMQALSVQRTEFGLLFSSQELPGIVLPIVGGLALSYLPYGPCAIFLSSSILLSTALCAIAVSNRSYFSLLLGRFLFGITDGALTTLQGAMIAHWFPKKIGYGFGIMLLVSRLSSFSGLALPAYIYARFGLIYSMWFSVVVCIPPVIATVLYTIFDIQHNRRVAIARQADETSSSANVNSSQTANSQPVLSFLNQGFIPLIRSFTVPFWLICYLWVVIAGVVFSTLHFAPDALSTVFGLSVERSGLITGSITFFAGVCSPLLGLLQDEIGHRAIILATCCGLLLTGSTLCAVAVANISNIFIIHSTLFYIGLIMLGAGFAAGPVTLMSSVALIVPDSFIPAGLGLYKATENAGLAVIHVATGALRDISGRYTWSFGMLSVLGLSGVLASFLVGRLQPSLADSGRRKEDLVLDSSSNEQGTV